MERGKRDVNPVVLKIGLAVAVSIGGMIFSFVRNKRIKPSSNKSSDFNNQVISAKESWGSKSDDCASNITPNSCQFDPLATDNKHDPLLDLSPNSKSNTDNDTYLLPEFNDLVKEFDTATMKTNKEVEIKNLRNTVKTLKERERNLRSNYSNTTVSKNNKPQVMELQNRLKLNNLEAKLFHLKIEALQTDNKRLQAQMADYAKVVTDLEAAKAKIKSLKKKLRTESTLNRDRILDLQERVEKMREDEHVGVVKVDPEVELKIRKLKELEAEAEELRKSNYSLEVEKSELGQRLEDVQILATSVLEDDETEKLKEERERLKKENEDLTKEFERLQADRCGEVEELVYLRWINACLRYELRNHQAGPGKTTARDLSKTLSPKSEEKAKNLILEYADRETIAEKGINFQELDPDQWSSSQASNLTDSGELDESLVSYPSPQKANKKVFGKLVRFLRGKDGSSGGSSHRHHRHSSNPSLERTEEETCSDYSFGNLGNTSKRSMDSQSSVYRDSDVGVHKRIDSIAESGGIGGDGSDSPSLSDGGILDMIKYAEVLKDSPAKSTAKYHRRSTLFTSYQRSDSLVVRLGHYIVMNPSSSPGGRILEIVLPTPPPPPPPLVLPPPPTDHRSALYVGDLHPDTTENDLYVLFATIGPLHSVRICRDRLSRKSLCYAYINFYLPSHAAMAISRLNHTSLRGKPMRIMWCERDPVGRRTGIANLFVKNLDSMVTDAKLEEVFEKFGRILSCKIAKDDYGKSKGFGFVQFDSEESANGAIDALDGSTLEDKIIFVAKFQKKSERNESGFTNVYVKNLDHDFTENLLREKFSEHGNVTSAVIMNDADGKSRGFGFVNFESHDSARKAIEALNGSVIGSKEWFVGKAMTKAEREGFLRKKDKNPSNLFIKNLATSVDEPNLEETFGVFGKVTLTKVVRHKNGISKGIGFVSFSTPEEAQKARDSLDGDPPEFRDEYHGKKLNVSFALSREECARNLQARFTPQPSIDNTRYLPSFYGTNQSFVRSSVYDRPYWQPNVYGYMQNLKPKIHHQNVKRAKLQVKVQQVFEQVIGNNASHGYNLQVEKHQRI
ncbi:hypothetical protein OSB04_004855 [Centaurea solstitialis]|uniref:RRM domain-containing protein n=1 Tax=Centaurea solstitialis TaxID=347529 RepID=A0AA38TEW2_9ASTR|nr:hypothetical protein OSB04_004855 [Centaurea solstitialis]